MVAKLSCTCLDSQIVYIHGKRKACLFAIHPEPQTGFSLAGAQPGFPSEVILEDSRRSAKGIRVFTAVKLKTVTKAFWQGRAVYIVLRT